MRKFFNLFIIIVTLAALCACSPQDFIKPSTNSPLPNSNSAATPGDISAPPSQSAETPVEATPEPENWQKLYTHYLEQNYSILVDDLLSPIAGIGIIDLDLDTYPELIIFDTGASASAGVHIFDIMDGEIVCISSSRLIENNTPENEYHYYEYIEANRTEDFRLMEDSKTGEKFFIVESGNGWSDGFYKQLIRFQKIDGVITPECLLFVTEESTEINGVVTNSGTYFKGTEEIDKSTYEKLYTEFYKNNIDAGYEATGAYIWSGQYDASYDGCMEMLKTVINSYEPAT